MSCSIRWSRSKPTCFVSQEVLKAFQVEGLFFRYQGRPDDACGQTGHGLRHTPDARTRSTCRSRTENHEQKRFSHDNFGQHGSYSKLHEEPIDGFDNRSNGSDSGSRTIAPLTCRIRGQFLLAPNLPISAWRLYVCVADELVAGLAGIAC